MENGQLPKSLHTVRILVTVAAKFYTLSDPQVAIALAAASIGYPDASYSDPVMHKARAQFAELRRKARAFATAA